VYGKYEAIRSVPTFLPYIPLPSQTHLSEIIELVTKIRNNSEQGVMLLPRVCSECGKKLSLSGLVGPENVFYFVSRKWRIANSESIRKAQMDILKDYGQILTQWL
jgi:hypothetical protein